MLKSHSKPLTRGMLSVLCLALVLLSGCSSALSPQSGTAQVQGEITLDGTPVDQAKVIFVPNALRNTAGKLMPLAFGRTDAEGKFEMKYSDGVDRLMTGQYTVIISKQQQSTPMSEDRVLNWEGEIEMLPGDVAKFEGFQNPDETIPAIYNSNSILVHEVKSSPNVESADFELSSIDPALREQKEE